MVMVLAELGWQRNKIDKWSSSIEKDNQMEWSGRIQSIGYLLKGVEIGLTCLATKFEHSYTSVLNQH